MREVIWIRRLALIGAILCFGVVVLGGYTRLSDSGLGCPDWPGCFGHVAPTGSAEHYATEADVRKAWIEMIHRYAAGTLGLIILVIAALSIVARRERGVNVWFGLVLQLVFSLGLGWLPSSGRTTPGLGGPGDRFAHLVLPATMLAAVHAAVRDEDFTMLPQCGEGVRHGQHDHMIIGRNEIGVQHMIRTFADELGIALS